MNKAGIGMVVLCGTLAMGVKPTLMAQAPSTPTFEVASVKPNKSGDGRVMLGIQPGGRFTATNVTLRALVRQAYGIQDFQIVGGPNWLNGDHFDILAKAEGDVRPTLPGTTGPLQLMQRALLADRFKLVAHNETRELPIYSLVLARSDGKLGPNLNKTATDCAAMAAARGRNGAPAAPPAPLAPGQRPMCGIMIGPGRMGGGGFPVSQLANTLGVLVQRTVVDHTGLMGVYDFDLTWTPDRLQEGPPGAPAPLINGAAIDPNGPSIFTAVQEQLGLKLDSQKGSVDVLVIDSAELPTPD